MKHWQLVPFYLIFLSITASEGTLRDKNPKAFFKPDLNRVDRARTAIIIRSSRSARNFRSFNNPFLLSRDSKNSTRMQHFLIQFQAKNHAPDKNGKVILKPVEPGFHEIQWMGPDTQRTLFLPIQSGEVWLIEILKRMESPNLPGLLVGNTLLESLVNPELNDLSAKLVEIENILKKITREELDVSEIISEQYEDELGAREDFMDFLEIRLRELQEISLQSCELFHSNKAGRVYLSGIYRFQDQSSAYFFLRLELDSEFKIRRYELVSPQLESDQGWRE